MENSYRAKGKGNAMKPTVALDLTFALTAHTHTRTIQNDFPIVITPPNLQNTSAFNEYYMNLFVLVCFLPAAIQFFGAGVHCPSVPNSLEAMPRSDC